MSEIQRSGKWNPGGGRWLDVIAVTAVVGYARTSTSATPFITLAEGADWTRIYTTPGTLQYRVSSELTDNGPLYTVEIKGFSPDDSPAKSDALDALFRQGKFIVRFTDNSGLVRIAGTPVEYMAFSDDFSTDADVPGARGYSLNLKGTLTQRPAYA